MAHAAGVHSEHFALDGRDVGLSLFDDLGGEGCFPILWDFDVHGSGSGLDRFLRIAVPTVCMFLLRTGTRGVSEMVLHFAVEHGLEHGAEDFFQGILHFLNGLGLYSSMMARAIRSPADGALLLMLMFLSVH